MNPKPKATVPDTLEDLDTAFEPPAPPAEPPERPRAARGGLIAGLIAGAALSVYMLAMNLAHGRDIWVGAKVAGYPFLGEAALQPGFDLGPVAVGVFCHFLVSVIWGVMFGWLAYGRSRSVTLALGAIWGVIVWIGMFYVVLPLAGAGDLTGMTPAGQAVLEHIGFGLVLAFAFLPFQPRELF